jgi:hypothetical protein
MARQARPKEKPAASPHHTILSLEITGGFLKGLKLDFADGLNCVIGGRGTGKTTVLELIRYVPLAHAGREGQSRSCANRESDRPE